ncbi:hypothetical protein Tco_1425532, partial [Tanacetum coccineum]
MDEQIQEMKEQMNDTSIRQEESSSLIQHIDHSLRQENIYQVINENTTHQVSYWEDRTRIMDTEEKPLHIPVSCQVGEDVVDSTTTSHLIISQEPIFSPILDTKSQDYEDFFILSKEEEECLDSLEELLSYVEQDAEVTPTDLNPPQLPRVVINQVEEDDLIFKNEKEQVKVSLVREEHHVVER